MLLVRLYRVEDKEVMVMDGSQGFMPETGAISLLASRESGVGADRVLVYCGRQHNHGFRAFSADGRETEIKTSEGSDFSVRPGQMVQVKVKNAQTWLVKGTRVK